METQTNQWRDIRNNQGLTIDDVLDEWRHLDIPASIKSELSRSKLGRFENGKARLSVLALAVLAGIYGRALEEVDADAAAEYEAIAAELRGRGSNSQPNGGNSGPVPVGRSRAA